MNKGKRLAATHLEWHIVTNLLQKLQKDKNYRLLLLVGIPVYTGLRIGDVLKLKWNDFLGKTDLTVVEQKTRKVREIRLNDKLREIVSYAYHSQMIIDPDEPIFFNRYKTKVISIQYVNRALKKMALHYQLTDNPTEWKSHLLRKSFGRHVFQNSNKSDLGLIILSELFGHSSISTTRLYLGLKREEFQNIYENL
jgi:integrase